MLDAVITCLALALCIIFTVFIAPAVLRRNDYTRYIAITLFALACVLLDLAWTLLAQRA
ncbi:MAG: hypothetical protein GY880_28540 [Planctomycetaceae bacterium]|nr:hypothetical protein [Planctomycetaceae bacterium]MCP4778182.1 hypothetical protein [Planctomycetaceae bacterium]